jgi:hypothetical protein
MCSNCIDSATKRAEYDCTYNSKEHVKERDADKKRKHAIQQKQHSRLQM